MVPPEDAVSFPFHSGEPTSPADLERIARRLRSLVEVFGQITFDVDLLDEVVDWAGGELLGYDSRTTGRTIEEWYELIHPDDRARVQTAMVEAIAERKPLFAEIRYLHANGDHRWFQARGVIHFDEAGRATNLIGVLEDISGRRSRALLEAERDFLAKNNDELKEFAYVASHDLQEPLRTITAFVELLNEDHRAQLGEEGAEYLDFIGEAASRLQRLINDLLIYSRMTSRSEEISEVDLRQIVDAALENLYAAIEKSGARLEIGPLPTLSGEESRLVLLFQNLVGNAIKFRRAEESPLISISSHETTDGWQITVADNGIGIPSDQHQRIFRLFHRLHSTRHYEGTGMGLAICTKIVERHGGRLWVESVPDEGATFHFTLARTPSSPAV